MLSVSIAAWRNGCSFAKRFVVVSALEPPPPPPSAERGKSSLLSRPAKKPVLTDFFMPARFSPPPLLLLLLPLLPPALPLPTELLPLLSSPGCTFDASLASCDRCSTSDVTTGAFLRLPIVPLSRPTMLAAMAATELIPSALIREKMSSEHAHTPSTRTNTVTSAWCTFPSKRENNHAKSSHSSVTASRVVTSMAFVNSSSTMSFFCGSRSSRYCVAASLSRYMAVSTHPAVWNSGR